MSAEFLGTFIPALLTFLLDFVTVYNRSSIHILQWSGINLEILLKMWTVNSHQYIWLKLKVFTLFIFHLRFITMGFEMIFHSGFRFGNNHFCPGFLSLIFSLLSLIFLLCGLTWPNYRFCYFEGCHKFLYYNNNAHNDCKLWTPDF